MSRLFIVNFTLIVLLALGLPPRPGVQGADCDPLLYDHLTNDFSFQASSAEGAVGDVVGVNVSLAVSDFHGRLFGFAMVVAYNGQMADFLGEPIYSESFEDLAYHPLIANIGGTSAVRSLIGQPGFIFGGNLRPEAAESLLSGGLPVTLGTFYFRLKGDPGDAFSFRFVDDAFYISSPGGNVPGYCLKNELQYNGPDFTAHSTLHVDGNIRILPGPATRPEPPPAPPDAKVYSSFPIKGGVDIKFELTGNTAQPGDVEVPVKVFITSDYEFIGYTIGGRFPTDSLELVRIEEQVRPGVENADNERGQFWAFMTNARRRLGAEGERVHVATLYFNVKTGAQGSIPISLETVYGPGSFPNWVNIRGMAESEEPITLQFEPLVITNGQLQIKEEGLTPRGDANFDRQIDLTDPVILLGYLFQGMSAPECPRAADFNLDGEVNISDPVAILATLFLGAPRPGGDESAEVPCQ